MLTWVHFLITYVGMTNLKGSIPHKYLHLLVHVHMLIVFVYIFLQFALCVQNAFHNVYSHALNFTIWDK